MQRPDLGTVAHLAGAILSVLVGVDVAATLAFLYYQHIDVEPIEEKPLDIVEWIIGIIIGAIAKKLV